jgi:hypothetical protein
MRGGVPYTMSDSSYCYKDCCTFQHSSQIIHNCRCPMPQKYSTSPLVVRHWYYVTFSRPHKSDLSASRALQKKCRTSDHSFGHGESNPSLLPTILPITTCWEAVYHTPWPILFTDLKLGRLVILFGSTYRVKYGQPTFKMPGRFSPWIVYASESYRYRTFCHPCVVHGRVHHNNTLNLISLPLDSEKFGMLSIFWGSSEIIRTDPQKNPTPAHAHPFFL